MKSTPMTILWPLLAAACANSHAVRPLGRHETAVTASVGGPLVQALGLTIPTPIATIGARHGIRDDLSVGGSWDLTAAAYGVAHVIPQAAWQVFESGSGRGPRITLLGAVHVLSNLSDTRVAPQLTPISSWRLGADHLIYGGVDAAAFIGHPTHFIWGPLVGLDLRLGPRLGFGVELKWLAPQHDVEPLAPTWISPGHHGFLAVLLGFSWAFAAGSAR